MGVRRVWANVALSIGFWSTIENWQSEFLQLFSFVVISALIIHHGSAESKDSDDRMERKIDEIHSAVTNGGS